MHIRMENVTIVNIAFTQSWDTPDCLTTVSIQNCKKCKIGKNLGCIVQNAMTSTKWWCCKLAEGTVCSSHHLSGECKMALDQVCGPLLSALILN